MVVLRMLTNYQVQLLNELKIFCEYEDDYFEQGMDNEKMQALEEGDCFSDTLFNLRREYDVLKSYGFILFEWSGDDEWTFEIAYLSITKKGEDYLTILVEDFIQQSDAGQGKIILEAVKAAISEEKEKASANKSPKVNFMEKLELVERVIGNVNSIVALAPIALKCYQGLMPLVSALL